MKNLLVALALIPTMASAWTNVQPNSSGGFNLWDSDDGVTQVVPAPNGGYSAYSSEGVTTYQPNNIGGINYYGTEGKSGYIVPQGDGFTVYEY